MPPPQAESLGHRVRIPALLRASLLVPLLLCGVRVGEGRVTGYHVDNEECRSVACRALRLLG